MAVRISRILHAGYVLECEGTQIAFDPIFENPFSRNCFAFPKVRFDLEEIRDLKLSAVFISHHHDDHCSLESLNLLDKSTPIFVYCLFEELLSWIRELGFEQVHPLRLNHPIQVGPFQVTPRRALDAEVDSIFHIEVLGLNLLNVVDSWIDPDTFDEHLRQVPWDLVLWPFQTMRELEVLSPSRAEPAPQELPHEWMQQLKDLKPRFVVPSSCQFQQESWSWYNHSFFPVSYKEFQSQVLEAVPGARVVRMDPSVSVILSQESLEMGTALPWVHLIEGGGGDYEYRPDLQPPTTSEIARHFAPLSFEETQRIHRYCRSEILEKFSSLENLESSYFAKTRHWQLSVYDHEGAATHFHYQIERGQMKILEKSEAPVAWLTEVPIAKLLAALDLGESLTSMYIRINDREMAPDIERDLRSADVLEDPLVRCLFDGRFGAYQWAQLRRLKADLESAAEGGLHSRP